MKKMFFALIGGMLLAGSAQASDYVFVEYNDARERIQRIDRKTLSVCALKARVAGMFGLNTNKFDLRRKSGGPLSDTKTLAGAGVGNGNILTVKETNYSSQCR